MNDHKTLLRISTAGSVDDGKSTLIGRLLFDTGNVASDTIKANTDKNAKLELANLTDGLRSEREQKITIDVAYRYFSSSTRKFILADCPGHEQYTRNMATGASTADLAIILIDGVNGITEQTKRHSFVLSLLGVRHFLVVINKMDLLDYSEEKYGQICRDYKKFSKKLDVPHVEFIPISALEGDNVVHPSKNMKWFQGSTVMNFLDQVYVDGDNNSVDSRFLVQYVSRPRNGVRVYNGQMLSGRLRDGDEVVVTPSLQSAKIAKLKHYTTPISSACYPQVVSLELDKNIDISRGTILAPKKNMLSSTNQIDCTLVWMDETPLDQNKTYLLKHKSGTIQARVEELDYRFDINNISRVTADTLKLNEIGRLRFSLAQELFFDDYRKNRETGSFILIDAHSNHTVAAGMIQSKNTLSAPPSEAKLQTIRNIRRETGKVSKSDKSKRLAQNPMTVWLTGLSGSGKSTLATGLEALLFEQGFLASRLDGDNLRFGLNKDLGFQQRDRDENIRRVAETAKLFNDSGLITICSFISPSAGQREQAKKIIGAENFIEVYVKSSLATCEQRDPKGLYKKARSGEIQNFTGITAPYDIPTNPKIIIDTEQNDLETSLAVLAEHVLNAIRLTNF